MYVCVLSMDHESTDKKMKIQVIKNPSPLVRLVTDLISLVRTLRSFRKPTMPNIVSV